MKCGLLTPAEDVNAKETEIALEMQKVENTSLVGFEEFHENMSTILHPNHYLNILLKRHLVGLYSGVLTQLEADDLERVNISTIIIQNDETFCLIFTSYVNRNVNTPGSLIIFYQSCL